MDDGNHATSSAAAEPTVPKARTIDSPWLTAEEARVYLRLPTLKALYEAVRRGDYECHRQGKNGKGKMLFHRGELDKELMKR